MGVKNLWDILESCKQTLPLHHLQNKKLCVDLSCWLVQFHTACRAQCPKDKPYLRTLFHRLRALIALNCSLILVTDGSIPAIKLSTYRRRLGLVSENTQEDTNSQPVRSLRRNMGSDFSCMIKEAKVLGLALGIPCLDGVEEAEAQCALLNAESLCDGCFSSDSDIFLFGARTVYKDIFLGEGGYVVCYEMEDIERKLGYGRNSLISLALLLGSDYSQRVQGFGPETACRVVKSIGDATVLDKVVAEGLTLRRTKGAKKTAKDTYSDANKENDLCYKQCVTAKGQNQGSSDQFLQVIDAYLKPKCHPADSEAVQRVCTQHPFIRAQFQQICMQYFGWSPDKTDEYILPKIAERDLRRFANLRSTSSDLGVRIPLDKMPVPCPVSEIIKQRKVQGIDYFEVSWQEIQGLRTSIVPADLMESACPEKIAEFIEKKCERKKPSRRPRPRKSTKADVSELDHQLQTLMLSIESESNAFPSTANCPKVTSIESESNAFLSTTSCPKLTSIESESFALPSTTKCPETNGLRNVIDLCSPSPPLRERKVPKCRQSISQHVAVIDICESETDDRSPEHEQKARELRLFLESIRRDLY